MVARQTSTRFLLKNLVQIWESGGCGFESHAECFFQICLGGFTIFGPCLINNVYDSFSMKVGGFLLCIWVLGLTVYPKPDFSGPDLNLYLLESKG